jgi:hypothetical protein
MKHRFELLELAGALCNGEITPAETGRLEQLLDGNAEAQRVYRQYMALHAELIWQQETLGELSEPGDSFIPSLKLGSGGRHLDWRRFGWPLALAACLLIGLAIGFRGASTNLGARMMNWSQPGGGEIRPTNLTAALSPVAKITGSRNCRWLYDGPVTGEPQSAVPIGYGSALFAGQSLRLVDGLAEITFDGGARIILEAPAELKIDAADSTRLGQGRLTASVPDGSKGFQVNLKDLTLVDHGTEFGVLTDRAGNAEVHVFAGVLEAQFRDHNDRIERSVMWNSDSAVRIDPHHNQIRELKLSGLEFVRTLAPPSGPSNGLLAKEDFDYPSAPLSEQNGGFGWGGPWEDIASDGDPSRINRVGMGSLKYMGLANSGNHALLEGRFNRVRRVLSTSFGGVFDAAGLIESQDGARLIGRDNTTIYVSFTQQISQVDQVFYGFELNRGDGNRNRVLCVGHAAAKKWTVGPPRQPIKDAGVTGWAVTSEFNGPENQLLDLGGLGPETTDVVFVVAKITFGENNEDKVEIFKNPQSLFDEGKCTPDIVGYGNFSFDRISLANFEGVKSFSVDHIRVGTNFPAVTCHQWDPKSLAKVGLQNPNGM